MLRLLRVVRSVGGKLAMVLTYGAGWSMGMLRALLGAALRQMMLLSSISIGLHPAVLQVHCEQPLPASCRRPPHPHKFMLPHALQLRAAFTTDAPDEGFQGHTF